MRNLSLSPHGAQMERDQAAMSLISPKNHQARRLAGLVVEREESVFLEERERGVCFKGERNECQLLS